MPTVFITGAGRGIGLEFARQYLADGWRVHGTVRSDGGAEALGALDGDLSVHRMDVTDQAQVDAVAAALVDEAIDLLINNSGIYGPRGIAPAEMDYAAWADVLQVNTLAPFRVAAAFAPHVARSRRGTILNISSRQGSIEQAGGGLYIYGSSKAALNAAMRHLAMDLKGEGVIVVVMHPGWVRTDMGREMAPLSVEESVSSVRQVVAGLTPDDTGRFLNYDGTEIPW
jgi:NAD(P)-dependent dehydrogenase (short-subunit alcohol dehydrogenase family)